MSMRVRALVGGGAAALIGVGLCAVAQAQTPTPAGELAARQAEQMRTLPPLPQPGPLPPPASCGAQNCITLEIGDNALRLLDRGVDPLEFGEGLTLSYEGAGEPAAIYFVAARYRNGRLANYAYTPWIRPENGRGVVPEGLAEAVAEAADPLGHGAAQIVAASRATPVWTVPVQTQSFLIESPKTDLIGAPEDAAIDEATAPEGLADAAAEQTLVLLTFAPADPRLRSPEMAAVTGVVLRVSEAD